MNHHLEADFHFLTPEQGGKRNRPLGLPGKYFPVLRPEGADGAEWHKDFSIVHLDLLTDAELIYPGEQVPCLLTFAFPERHKGRWHSGMQAQLFEGLDRFAICIITKVLL